MNCTAKQNSLGCIPAIGWAGAASASNTDGFRVSAWDVRNQKPGLLLYSLNGQAAIPVQGGTLCMNGPYRRTPGVTSGGSAQGADCTGLFSIDVNAFAHGAFGGNPSPSLTLPGSVIDCQWWGRDPGFVPPNNTTLSDALEFVVGP